MVPTTIHHHLPHTTTLAHEKAVADNEAFLEGLSEEGRAEYKKRMQG